MEVRLSERVRETVKREMQFAAFKLASCWYHVLLVSAVAQGLTVKEEEWQSWKEQHGKEFTNEEEEKLRLGIWMSNLAAIEEHNRQNHNFTLKMNHFGDLVGNNLYNLSLLNTYVTGVACGGYSEDITEGNKA